MKVKRFNVARERWLRCHPKSFLPSVRAHAPANLARIIRNPGLLILDSI